MNDSNVKVPEKIRNIAAGYLKDWRSEEESLGFWDRYLWRAVERPDEHASLFDSVDIMSDEDATEPSETSSQLGKAKESEERLGEGKGEGAGEPVEATEGSRRNTQPSIKFIRKKKAVDAASYESLKASFYHASGKTIDPELKSALKSAATTGGIPMHLVGNPHPDTAAADELDGEHLAEKDMSSRFVSGLSAAASAIVAPVAFAMGLFDGKNKDTGSTRVSETDEDGSEVGRKNYKTRGIEDYRIAWMPKASLQKLQAIGYAKSHVDALAKHPKRNHFIYSSDEKHFGERGGSGSATEQKDLSAEELEREQVGCCSVLLFISKPHCIVSLFRLNFLSRTPLN